MNEQTMQSASVGLNMIQITHLYRFNSGASPDWPPCDICRAGGDRGDDISAAIIFDADDDFVSNIG